MSEGPGRGGSFNEQVEAAERRLEQAARLASEAEHRAEAEIRALEADLDKVRAAADRDLEQLRLAHEEELQDEREARERAIATAEQKLGEIEAQADTAEQTIAAAEERANRAEQEVADEQARAREGAAAWLRSQLEAIRREAEGR
jgi:dTMP kinase